MPSTLIPRRLIAYILLLSSGWLWPIYALAQSSQPSTAATVVSKQFASPAQQQQITTALINQLVEARHYRKLNLNNRFSEKILTKYIEQLDPGKSFFLQADITRFDAWRHQLDDYIKRGELQPAFTIFDTFRMRVNERIDYALARVNEPFDFTRDETFDFEREDAPWAQSAVELNDYWRKRIKNDILKLQLAKKAAEDIPDTLSRRYKHTARQIQQWEDGDIFENFITAYVSTIEPHTSYYSPRRAENFKINMRLSLEGIGAVLQTDDEYTLVRRIIAGGPAGRSGQLQADDRIVGVGQGAQETSEIVDVIGWRLDDIVDLIRGPKASVVTLEILPGEHGLDGETEIISLVRDKIKLEDRAASTKIITMDGTRAKVGVLQLPSFYSDLDYRANDDANYRSTTRDVRTLLAELVEDDLAGLVIDLRDNGGGALSEAIALTGLFIPQGPVVQVQDSDGRTQIERDPDSQLVYAGPLAVLVNEYSASASEIFAGAIQDYGRGLVVGVPTFGKGTVQQLLDLNEVIEVEAKLGQLKMTIAQFFRVSGDSTQHRGVIPDIIWPLDTDRAEAVGERRFDNAIAWRRIPAAEFEPFYPSDTAPDRQPIIAKHQARVDQQPQFEYARQIEALHQAARQQTTISLHREQRQADRSEREQRRLAIENQLRVAEGKPTYATVAEFEATQETEGSEDNAEDKTENKAKDKAKDGTADVSSTDWQADVFLTETAQIVLDFASYLDPTTTAAVHDR